MYINVCGWDLQLLFALMMLSMLAFLFDLVLIIQSQSYAHLAIRLYLYLIFFEIAYFLPQIIFPFFYDIKGTGKEDFNDSNFCPFQGKIMDASLLTTSLITNYMGLIVMRILQGKVAIKYKYEEAATIAAIFFFSYLIVFLTSKSDQYISYGITRNGDIKYFYCNIKIPDMKQDGARPLIILILFLVLQSTTFFFSIYLTAQCNQKKKSFQVYGLKLNEPLLRIEHFGLLIQVVWNFNLIIKLCDIIGLVRPAGDSTFLNILWLLANSVICILGMLSSSLFYLSFSEILLQRAPRWLRTIIHLAKSINCFQCIARKPKSDQDETLLVWDSEKEKDSTQQVNTSLYQ